MKLEIELTQEQEKFLKLFAQKHYSGAEDNRMTSDCLHVVETKRERFIIYHEDLWDYYSDLDLKFSSDDAHEVWYNSPEELVNEHLDDTFDEDEEISINVLKYEDVESTCITGLNGEQYFISNYNDYFKAYGIDYIAITWVEEYYEPIAYFFILDEAKKYLNYQRHNLCSPRVYTHSAGYSNYGDFVHFRDLLLVIGSELSISN